MMSVEDKSTPRVAASLSAPLLLAVQQAFFFGKEKALGKVIENGLHAAKGAGVHGLKRDASWVQNGVSQFGLYLPKV